MFITTKYKMFEVRIDALPNNFSDDDIRLAQEIESKKDFIKDQFELIFTHRQPFGDTIARKTGSRYFDIYKINEGIKSSIGVFDILAREFILFYSEGRQLRKENYLRIKSENFFDQLERVYYYTFMES